jgi:hypothetical protein
MATDLIERLYASIEGLGEPEAGSEAEFPSASEFGPKSAQRELDGNGKLAESLESSRVPEFPSQTGDIYARERKFEKIETGDAPPPAGGRARKDNEIDGNYGNSGSSDASCGVFSSRGVPVAGATREVEALLLADGRQLHRFRAAGPIPEPGESEIDVCELIDEARDRHLVLVADGPELHVTEPPEIETPAILLEALADKTAEVIAFLRGESRARVAALDAKRPIIELGPGVPAAWREGYDVLRSMPEPRGFRPGRWDRVVAAAAKFLPEWGDRAAECGWGVRDVFGCDPGRPEARFDCMGLVMLLDGFEVIGVDDRGADLVSRNGARQRYRIRPMPAHTVALWDIPGEPAAS